MTENISNLILKIPPGGDIGTTDLEVGTNIPETFDSVDLYRIGEETDGTIVYGLTFLHDPVAGHTVRYSRKVISVNEVSNEQVSSTIGNGGQKVFAMPRSSKNSSAIVDLITITVVNDV